MNIVVREINGNIDRKEYNMLKKKYSDESIAYLEERLNFLEGGLLYTYCDINIKKHTLKQIKKEMKLIEKILKERGI